MLQSTFLPTDPITAIYFCKSTAFICQHAWSTLFLNKKLNFCHIQALIFLQSYVITLGGRLLETGNKRIGRISGVKSGRGRLRNLPSGRLGENFWKSI